jgi:hypothetical protein
MKKLLLSITAALLLISVAFGVVSAATGVSDPSVLSDLARLRQATVKYQDVNIAIADGFLPTPHCVAHPELGGMGYHYVNPARVMNGTINMFEPEILLYAEVEGKIRLIGVEYMLPLGPPGAAIPDEYPPAPVLFGATFDGPMPAPEPDVPPHYALHVWLWQANPSGIFSPFNPNINCPAH